MGVEPPCHGDARVEVLAAVTLEAGHTELEAGLDELDVRSLAQRVVDDGLVFVDGNRACRVDEVTTGLAVGLYAVNSAENELLLQVGE